MASKVKEISENIIEWKGERFVKEDSKGWLDIQELGISVEIEIHDKNKSWDELNLSEREDELLTYDQCVKIANIPKYAKILKMDGSSSNDDFFIKQPFDLNRKNGRVARFFAGSDCCDLDCFRNSGGSDSYLGVRFCKKISKDKKE